MALAGITTSNPTFLQLRVSTTSLRHVIPRNSISFPRSLYVNLNRRSRLYVRSSSSSAPGSNWYHESSLLLIRFSWKWSESIDFFNDYQKSIDLLLFFWIFKHVLSSALVWFACFMRILKSLVWVSQWHLQWGLRPAISLTESTLKHLNKMRAERGEDLCLRIGVKQGGCSGMSYTMDFENRANARPDDSTIEYEGFAIGKLLPLVCFGTSFYFDTIRSMS